MIIIQENNDVYCKPCDEGIKTDNMLIKPVKKEKNGLIYSNFGVSVRKLFDND